MILIISEGFFGERLSPVYIIEENSGQPQIWRWARSGNRCDKMADYKDAAFYRQGIEKFVLRQENVSVMARL